MIKAFYFSCSPSGSLPLIFFFNETATTEIYTVSDTLSLHDALPISRGPRFRPDDSQSDRGAGAGELRSEEHTSELQSPDTISYAVFCLKKKTNIDYLASEVLWLVSIKHQLRRLNP